MAHKRDATFTRREALGALSLGGAAFVTGCAATGGAGAPVQATSSTGGPLVSSSVALAGNHTPLPLPFAAGSLAGLSDKMISSHHENNYGGAVKNLNRVEQELTRISPETPPFLVAALRDRELTFRNSKTLHEAYFGNLGGDGRRSGPIEAAVAEAYGTAARFEEHLRATALGLGGGSGWVILGLELDTGALRTFSSGNHKESLATSVPLLVLDMYEHSYQIDFGAGVARYLDAFVANVNWDEVNRRLERAKRASALLRGAAA